MLKIKMKVSEFIQIHKRIFVIALQALILSIFCVVVQMAYVKGLTDGVHRTEQCHAQYGVMKADYEEHFICMY